MKGRRLLLVPILLLLGIATAVAATAGDREEFFVVSSIDAPHGRIVLKLPTEVTLVMQVTGQTVYRDEAGKPLRLADLRTGDTAYVTYRQEAGGASTALLLRLGPMTVQELQRRYLKPGLR